MAKMKCRDTASSMCPRAASLVVVHCSKLLLLARRDGFWIYPGNDLPMTTSSAWPGSSRTPQITVVRAIFNLEVATKSIAIIIPPPPFFSQEQCAMWCQIWAHVNLTVDLFPIYQISEFFRGGDGFARPYELWSETASWYLKRFSVIQKKSPQPSIWTKDKIFQLLIIWFMPVLRSSRSVHQFFRHDATWDPVHSLSEADLCRSLKVNLIKVLCSAAPTTTVFAPTICRVRLLPARMVHLWLYIEMLFICSTRAKELLTTRIGETGDRMGVWGV